MGESSDPQLLVTLQVIIGAAAAATAWGAWRGAPWTPWAALAYGVVTAGMIASLQWMLGLPESDRGGLFAGAGFVLAFSLLSAWYLRRATRPALPARPGQPDPG